MEKKNATRDIRVSTYLSAKELKNLAAYTSAQCDTTSNVLRRMFNQTFAAWAEEVRDHKKAKK